MGDYPGPKVTNSGPTGTPLRKQAIQHPTKRTFTKQPTYLSPMQNTNGTLITYQGFPTYLGIGNYCITRMAVRKEHVSSKR